MCNFLSLVMDKDNQTIHHCHPKLFADVDIDDWYFIGREAIGGIEADRHGAILQSHEIDIRPFVSSHENQEWVFWELRPFIPMHPRASVDMAAEYVSETSPEYLVVKQWLSDIGWNTEECTDMIYAKADMEVLQTMVMSDPIRCRAREKLKALPLRQQQDMVQYVLHNSHGFYVNESAYLLGLWRRGCLVEFESALVRYLPTPAAQIILEKTDRVTTAVEYVIYGSDPALSALAVARFYDTRSMKAELELWGNRSCRSRMLRSFQIYQPSLVARVQADFPETWGTTLPAGQDHPPAWAKPLPSRIIHAT